MTCLLLTIKLYLSKSKSMTLVNRLCFDLFFITDSQIMRTQFETTQMRLLTLRNTKLVSRKKNQRNKGNLQKHQTGSLYFHSDTLSEGVKEKRLFVLRLFRIFIDTFCVTNRPFFSERCCCYQKVTFLHVFF